MLRPRSELIFGRKSRCGIVIKVNAEDFDQELHIEVSDAALAREIVGPVEDRVSLRQQNTLIQQRG